MVAVLAPISTSTSTAVPATPGRPARAVPVRSRPVSGRPAFGHPAFDRPATAGRPALRVIQGGRAPRRSIPGAPSPAVYLRRRILVAAAAVVVLLALVAGVRAAASLLTAPVTPTAPVAATFGDPIVADSYVVRPGDTLWSIASRLDPGSDPRPLVDALRQRVVSPALDAGQRIDVSGLGS